MSIRAQPTAPPSEAGFIDEKEVLRRLPISRRSLFNHRKAGKIAFMRLGDRVIYHWPTIEQNLLRQQKGVPE
jgi:hypothetical protein